MTEARSTMTQSSVSGDPTAGAVALLTVVVVLLGLQLAGAIPAASAGLFVPVLLVAGIAQLLLGLLAVRKGENVIGLFFTTFGPFIASFGLLITGLQHGWWAITPADIPHAEAAFLMGWTIVLTLWFFLSVVLPAIFTVLITLVDVALWCLVIGIWNTSSGPQKFAGWMLLATGAGGLYFMSALWLGWAGAAALPLGRPLIGRRRSATVVTRPA
jgi:succinate-acetate transporter protein